jgi:hypothetical protein
MLQGAVSGPRVTQVASEIYIMLSLNAPILIFGMWRDHPLMKNGDECGTIGGMTGETELLRQSLADCGISHHKPPHKLIWDRIRTVSVGNR